MASRTNEQRAARHLQTLTGWSYTECLALSREQSADAIEALAKIRGTPILTNNPEYVKWRKRAKRGAMTT